MKQMITHILKIFYILSFFLHATGLTFHNLQIHNIGEGQAVTATYYSENKKIVVIFDAGSKANQCIEKLEALKNDPGQYTDVLLPKRHTENALTLLAQANQSQHLDIYVTPKKKDNDSRIRPRNKNSNESDNENITNPNNQQSSKNSKIQNIDKEDQSKQEENIQTGLYNFSEFTASSPQGKTASSQRIKKKKNEFETLFEVIENAEYLIPIISHPDTDHMNLIKSLLEQATNAQVLAILGSDWPMNGNDEGILNALKNRNHAIILIPAYAHDQKFIKDTQEGKIINLVQPNKIMYSEMINIFAARFGLPTAEAKSTINTSTNIFTHTPNTQVTQTMYPLFSKKLFKQLGDNVMNQDNPDLEILKYLPQIDLLSVNLQAQNIPNVSLMNQKSIVASISEPSHHFSFVSTADAGPNAFTAIMANRVKNSPHSLFPPDHLVIMLLPHHGSEHNIMPNDTLQFFRPNIFIASTDGKSHHHPHKKAISSPNNYLKTPDNIDNNTYFLRTNYIQAYPAVVSYYDKDDKIRIWTQYQEKKNTTPAVLFYSTNMMGDMRIQPIPNSNGRIKISAKNNYIISIDNPTLEKQSLKYLINITQQIEKAEFDQNAQNELNKGNNPAQIIYNQIKFRYKSHGIYVPIAAQDSDAALPAQAPYILKAILVNKIMQIYKADLLNDIDYIVNIEQSTESEQND